MSAREAHPLQSNDILGRQPQTDRAVVKHILIGWRDLEGVYGGRMDPRAKKRSRWDAENLTKKLFKSRLDKAEKLHLQQLFDRIALISNVVEDAADRLEIMAVKRRA